MAETNLEVGDVWEFGLTVETGAIVAVTVTNPSGTTSTPTPVVVEGEVSISVPLSEEGRYLAVVTVTTDGVPDVTAHTVYAETPGGTVPDITAVKNYLDSAGGTSWPDGEIQDALDAETRAQARVCNIPATYPDDLAEALKRRVARNLAARQVPIAQITSFDGGQMSSRVPAWDNEVKRFEGPFRKVILG
jgi:hypothetical protein